MDYRKSIAPSTTVTRNLDLMTQGTGNIYETVIIVSRRSNQISVEMKQELNKKLEEFASYSDNLEEVFENREQIEISKFYERLPKPTLIALQELEEGKIFYRNPEKTGQAKIIIRLKMLKGKNILVGVTGGIAAYKTATIIRLLVKEGAEVKVIMTDHAKEFITPLTLATLIKKSCSY